MVARAKEIFSLIKEKHGMVAAIPWYELGERMDTF